MAVKKARRGGLGTRLLQAPSYLHAAVLLHCRQLLFPQVLQLTDLLGMLVYNPGGGKREVGLSAMCSLQQAKGVGLNAMCSLCGCSYLHVAQLKNNRTLP